MGKENEKMSVNLGFIGFGLTGGSLAKAIKAAHRDYRISAYDTDRESLVQAKKEGILDTIWDENRLVLDQCDFLFLCAPGECNCAYLKYIREDIVGSDCILTDVGNLKSHIHQEVEKVCLTSNFIGGHPLFCQDAVGYANAKAELITQAPCYLLTPSEDVSFQKLTRFTELITSLGVSPMVLTAQEHDYILAGAGHLPQLLKASFLSMIQHLDREGQKMLPLLPADSQEFPADTAALQQTCMANAPYISEILDEYIRTLIQLRCQLDQQDDRAINRLLTHLPRRS